jgi:hypothetical protein
MIPQVVEEKGKDAVKETLVREADKKTSERA